MKANGAGKSLSFVLSVVLVALEFYSIFMSIQPLNDPPTLTFFTLAAISGVLAAGIYILGARMRKRWIGKFALWNWTIYYVILLGIASFMDSCANTGLNLLPLHTIQQYLSLGRSGLATWVLTQLAVKITKYVPLYIVARTKDNALATLRSMALVVVFIVLIEVIQGVFHLGAADIDDVILGFTGLVLAEVIIRAVVSPMMRLLHRKKAIKDNF